MQPNTILFNTLLLLLSFVSKYALGDVAISKPLSDQTYSASSGSVSIGIAWIESNASPALGDITSYTFTLCTGPNSDIYAFKDSVVKVEASELNGKFQYTFNIDASEGADGDYYIQVYAVTSEGFTIHYTKRFTLTDMTGSYQPTVGLVSNPPDAQTSLSTGATVISINSASFSIPYTSQTGYTRYAPMQLQPGTKVTKGKSDWTRKYPTSAVTYYTSIRTTMDQSSTITPGWSYSWTSAINWASPAPFPSENGGWYNPSVKLLSRTPTLVKPTEQHSGTVSTLTTTSS
ncbi:hypothetical protein WICMUC_005587 [Wickerhamomyces mucosus]|uniref:Cell wall synthesis protein KRE9 n=1 Tax=Wickerhamomyces mucosus TaxID=1378264 RepID=A0A9P8T540_9ASCO|nr:hypothetical protein WICMUC_005587 [Wickerhamomyces mucosus]